MTEPAVSATQPAPPQQSTQRRGGGCCLRSCLGCSVVILILGAGLIFAWLRFGPPWVETQKARLVERFPIIEKVLALKSALPFQGITLTGGETGSTARADFPADVWLPDRPLDGAFNTTPGMALAVLTLTPIDPATLAGQARSEMAARGWQRTPVPDLHDGIALVFERDERITSMKIFAVENGTELWVRWSIRAAPQPNN